MLVEKKGRCLYVHQNVAVDGAVINSKQKIIKPAYNKSQVSGKMHCSIQIDCK